METFDWFIIAWFVLCSMARDFAHMGMFAFFLLIMLLNRSKL